MRPVKRAGMQNGRAPLSPAPGRGSRRAERPSGRGVRPGPQPSSQAPSTRARITRDHCVQCKRPRVFDPLESDGAHWVQRQFSLSFSLSVVLRGPCTGFTPPATRLGLGAGRAAPPGVSGGESAVGGQAEHHAPAGIFLEKRKPLPREKQLPHPLESCLPYPESLKIFFFFSCFPQPAS